MVAREPTRGADLRELLARDLGEASKVIESLLDGPMTFTPVETPKGRRYEVTGRIATGDVLRVLSSPAAAQNNFCAVLATHLPARSRKRMSSIDMR